MLDAIVVGGGPAGLSAAGDVTPGLQLVQVAAGSGAVAGIGCAMSLENDPETRRRFPPAWRTRSRSPAPEGSS